MEETLKFSQYFEKAYEELKGKSLAELEERFKGFYHYIIRTLMNSSYGTFKNWCIVQAPITLIKPHPTISAFAGSDGRIYINPAFLNAFYYYLKEEEGYSEGEEELLQKQAEFISYIITHEMHHIILRHVWEGEELIKKLKEKYEIPEAIIGRLLNVIMDYTIEHNINQELYKEIYSIVKKALMPVYSKEMLFKYLEKFEGILNSQKACKALEMIDEIEGLGTKTWKELTNLVTQFLNQNQTQSNQTQSNQACQAGSNQNQTSQAHQASSNQNQKAGSNQNQTNQAQNQVSRVVSDGRGNIYEFDEVADITDGYLENIETQDDQNQNDQNQNQNQSQNQNQVQQLQDQAQQLQSQSQQSQSQQNQQQNQSRQNQQQSQQSISSTTIQQAQQAQSKMQQQHEIMKKLENLLVSYGNVVKRAGLGKGILRREIDNLYDVSEKSLKTLLLNFLSSVIYTPKIKWKWTKLNKKQPEKIPGKKRLPQDKNCVAFFDVSGSIGNDELNEFASVLKGLLHKRLVRQVHLFTFDDGLQEKFTIKKPNEFVKILAKGLKGGGGTHLTPALTESFKEIKNHLKTGDVVMIFTDSEISEINDSKRLDQLKQSIVSFAKRTKNPILWFHVNNDLTPLERIMTKLTKLISPVKIDVKGKTLQFVPLNKFISNKKVLSTNPSP